ncbi:MAG: sugar transferase [Candidatus Eremiobacteraeota bacterium]|nr:sugar transferase [Candidatus Eremiobacteraeota bacterium]
MTVVAEQFAPSAVISVGHPRASRFSRTWTIIIAAGDLVMFLLSAWLGTRLVEAITRVHVNAEHVALSAAIYVALWFWIFKRLGLYERSFAMSMRDEIYATVAAMSLGMAPQLILFTLIPSISSSRLVLLTSLGISIAAVTTMRAVAHRARDVEALARDRRVALVGAYERLRAAREELRAVPNTRVLSLAVDDLDIAMATQDTTRASTFERMPWFVKALRWECDTLIFTEIPDPRHIPGLLAAARKWNLQVAFAAPRLRTYAYQLGIDALGHQALIVPRQLRAASPAARLVKRAVDLVIATVALVLTAPLMLACALAITLEDGGPILYRQTRVGRGGVPFEILKFRSMRLDAESAGARFAIRGDSRVTRVGRILRRFSLDELPQLFNVLRGEMSIVGPRPERPIFVEAFRAYHPRYDERHLVLPGITGWAQVNFKRIVAADEVEEKLAHDLFYIENWGLFLDFMIVVKTAVEVLFHRSI